MVVGRGGGAGGGAGMEAAARGCGSACCRRRGLVAAATAALGLGGGRLVLGDEVVEGHVQGVRHLSDSRFARRRRRSRRRMSREEEMRCEWDARQEKKKTTFGLGRAMECWAYMGWAGPDQSVVFFLTFSPSSSSFQQRITLQT